MKKIATIALLVSLISVHTMGLLAQHLQGNNSYSVLSEQTFKLTKWDSLQALSIPEIRLPEHYKSREGRDLPPFVNNADLPYFRPIFSQANLHESYANCGQSSGIGYNFTYEINRSRGLPANMEANQYTPQFTWNFMNGGEGWYGVSYFHSFEVLKKVGNPSVEDYGGMYNGGNQWWMSGYEAYQNTMHNRIEEVYFIDVSTAEGIETLKYWLFDHLEGAESGGVASFYAASPYNMKTLAENSPEAGKLVITSWAYPATHAMTIVGYNDSIRYDYNNDGQFTNHIDINNDGNINAKDWEIGGFLFANSYGNEWADSGFCYVMYNSLAQAFGEGGVWNQSVNVLKVKPDYQPLLGLKIKLKHNSRNKLKIMAGVSSDTTLNYPAIRIDFPIFNFQGGNYKLQGIDTVSNADELELALDISSLLGEVEPGNDAKFFIQIVEKDPEDIGTGQILYVALSDFNSQQEIVLLDAPRLIENNGITTVSGVAGLQFDKVMIITEALPVAEPETPYSCQLEAAGGLLPYKWFLLKDYTVGSIEANFPANEGEAIPFSNNDSDAVAFDLPFSFPFYGDTLHQIFIHIDGFVTFENNDLPYPYFIGESTMLTDNRMIAPFMTDLLLKPLEGHNVSVDSEDDYFLIKWKATYAEPVGNKNFVFALKLFPSGQIITYYDQMDIPDNIIWTSGLSNGDERNYIVNNELNYLSSLSGKNRSYQPVSSVTNKFSLSPEGVLKGNIQDEEIISSCRISVTDGQEITTIKEFQLSTGLIISYEISSGTDDNIECGETASFNARVQNISSQTVEDIHLNYTVEDPFLAVIHEKLYVGTLHPGEIKEIDSSLVISIENNVPDQHSVVLNCSLTSDEKNWYYESSLVINAPFLNVDAVDYNGVGWMEPGLANNVFFQVKNRGHATANMIEARFVCESGIIEVVGSNAVILNALYPNDNTMISYKLKADAMVVSGSMIPCQIEFYKDGTLIDVSDYDLQVGQNPVLLIDMDPKHTSMLKLQADLERLDLPFDTSSFIPSDLYKHKSVFVLLGTFYSNHEITYEEGLKLIEYLDNGGNIYMEGRVTWTQPPSPVHEAFNVDMSGNQFFIIDTVFTSQNDSVLQKRLFFNHPEPYANYYFTPQDEAFSVLNFTKNDSACVVANITDNYRTIASIIDYGSLERIDTSYIAEDYLYFITDFFGLYESTIGINEFYETSKENLFISAFPNPFADRINIQFKLPESGRNLLQICNSFGQVIYTKYIYPVMENDRIYELEWNGLDSNGNKVNSGMYFIKIVSGNTSSIAKIIRL